MGLGGSAAEQSVAESADDAALVRAAVLGDRPAFALLIGRHRPLLLRLCRRALGDAGLAEDAAQETVLQAMLSLDRLAQPARFGAWLAGIGLNVSRQMLRERARTPDYWSLDALLGGRLVREPVDLALDPVDRAAEQDIAAQVRRAVNDLPRGQRAAVLLFYLQGLSHAETAALLGIEVGAVKTRLHKARASLRRQLWSLWQEETAAMNIAETTPTTRPIEVRVFGVGLNLANDRRVVILEEVAGSRKLPIWIGHFEGDAIAMLHQKVEMSRPLTHALAASLVQAAGFRLREARVERLAEETFYGIVAIEGPDGATREVDARPSDAIALALHAGAPMYVQSEVFDAVAEQGAAHPTDPRHRPIDYATLREEEVTIGDRTAQWARTVKVLMIPAPPGEESATGGTT